MTATKPESKPGACKQNAEQLQEKSAEKQCTATCSASGEHEFSVLDLTVYDSCKDK